VRRSGAITEANYSAPPGKDDPRAGQQKTGLKARFYDPHRDLYRAAEHGTEHRA
jgi:hypothetical protein